MNLRSKEGSYQILVQKCKVHSKLIGHKPHITKLGWFLACLKRQGPNTTEKKIHSSFTLNMAQALDHGFNPKPTQQGHTTCPS